MTRNIIFIDVDGVLNTVKCLNNCLTVFKAHSCPCKPEYGIDDILRDRFIAFVNRCPENTQFVLISSWRKEPTLLSLFKWTFNSIILKYAGYIDITKDEDRRHNSINRWLSNNITDHDYKYVIFDDREYTVPDFDNKGLKYNIEPYAGLSELNCASAIVFFREP